jgi:hypothetical protein
MNQKVIYQLLYFREIHFIRKKNDFIIYNYYTNFLQFFIHDI